MGKREDGQLGLFGGASPQGSEEEANDAPAQTPTPRVRRPEKPSAASPPREAAPEPDEPKVLGVAEVDRRLQRMLERATARLRVRGEVRGLKRAGSGHLYFTLKDEREDAILEAVMYRTAPPRARARVVEGEQVVVEGRITLYPPRGRVQLIVNDVLQTARGALLEALEQLKQKLAGRGALRPRGQEAHAGRARYDRGGHQPRRCRGARLHSGPRISGVAGRASWWSTRRFKARRLRAASPEPSKRPTDTSGPTSSSSTRGGGSLEDLAAFNDEGVVRAIAAADTPVLSAVGHQIDRSLSDLAADASAATPSQAAELLVVDARARQQHLAALRGRLLRSSQQDLRARRAQLADLRAGLGEPGVSS